MLQSSFFVRLADDRRFVWAVLFLFFVVLVLIRISGRHRVANDYEGAPVNQPGGQFLGNVWGHAIAPSQARHRQSRRAVLAAAPASIAFVCELASDQIE